MQAVMNAVLLKPAIREEQSGQLTLFQDEEIRNEKKRVSASLDEAADREKISRSIFAQNTIKANEIEEDLRAMDEAIGNVKTVEHFVVEGLRFLGVQVEQKGAGYKVFTINIPERLRAFLTDKPEILISFKSPTPDGFSYIGRNHSFTENLSQTILNNALNQDDPRASRASVVRTSAVKEKTVLLQFRVRNVIAEHAINKEIVAEEMWLWGYRGDITEERKLSHDEAVALFFDITSSENIEPGEQKYWLEEEMSWIHDPVFFRKVTDPIALTRAENLVESHTRVRKLLKGNTFKVVEPVLPMDVMGICILLPVLN
jgi:hypothetical protein